MWLIAMSISIVRYLAVDNIMGVALHNSPGQLKISVVRLMGRVDIKELDSTVAESYWVSVCLVSCACMEEPTNCTPCPNLLRPIVLTRSKEHDPGTGRFETVRSCGS